MNTPDQIAIPQEFVKLSNIESEKYSSKLYSGTRLIDADNSGISNTSFIAGARWAYRHLMGKPSGMRWVDAEDDLPNDQDEEYFVRWKKDGEWAKLTAFYDNDAKQFYTIEPDCRMEYMSVREFKGLQWLYDPSSPETGSVIN